MRLILLLVWTCYALPLKIAAFNIQVFGQRKSQNTELLEIYASIVKRYDIIFIQEIRDKSGKSIKRLIDEVNKTHEYDYLISERLGPSITKEQYAYLYKKHKVELIDYKQSENREINRPPLIARFEFRGFDFSLIGAHLSPKVVPKELMALNDVYQNIRKEWGEEDILILGDLNAGCRYLSKRQLEKSKLWNDNLVWLIDHAHDTSVAKSSCPYDRIIATNEIYHHVVRANVYFFDRDYSLKGKTAKYISDHYPVEVEINI